MLVQFLNIDFSNFIAFLTAVSSDNDIKIEILENYGVKIDVELEPNDKKQFAIIIGATDTDENYANVIKDKYKNLENINTTYNNTKKDDITGSIVIGGPATENVISISSNDNGKITFTVTYDTDFTSGTNQPLTFDAATGEQV